MADLSDVTAYLARTVAQALYPNGESSPSAVGIDVRVFEGWPLPDQLDLDMAGLRLVNGIPVPRAGGHVANVSVYPLAASTTPYQILDNTYVTLAATYGMQTAVQGDVVTVTGEPRAGEYLTLIADGAHVYSRTGANTAAILAALAADADVDYDGVSADATTITLPYGHSLEVRIGGVGKLGKVTHRQVQSVMVTVWAPNDQHRSAIAALVDNVLKRSIVVSLPDTTQAKIVYNRTHSTDEQTATTVYRRDLVYDVEYATLYEFPGYVVTSFGTTVAGGNWGLPEQTPVSTVAIS